MFCSGREWIKDWERVGQELGQSMLSPTWMFQVRDRFTTTYIDKMDLVIGQLFLLGKRISSLGWKI